MARDISPAEADSLIQAQIDRAWSEESFQLIGMSQDEDLETLRRFLEEHEMGWSQIRQRAPFEGEVLPMDEVLALYNVFGIPESYVIDRTGRIAAKDLCGEALGARVAALIHGTEDR